MDRMLNNNNNGAEDEINVEGYALKFTSRFPFEDPSACRDIYRQVGVHLEESLKNRAERHKRKAEGTG